MPSVHNGMCVLNVADTKRSITSFYTFFVTEPFFAIVTLEKKTSFVKRSMKKMLKNYLNA